MVDSGIEKRIETLDVICEATEESHKKSGIDLIDPAFFLSGFVQLFHATYFMPSLSRIRRAARQPLTWPEPTPCHACVQLLVMNTFSTGVLLGTFCH